MGRSLFSQNYQAPAVRVEPEQPPCEKWSYWNPFDPDSEEFFRSDDTVYEAFVDPSSEPSQPRIQEGEEQRALVVEDDSSSSEGSSSGRGSPLSDSGELSVEEIDLELRRRASWDFSGQGDGLRREEGAVTRGRDAPLAHRENAERARAPWEIVSQLRNAFIDPTSASMPAAREPVVLTPSDHELFLQHLARPQFDPTMAGQDEASSSRGMSVPQPSTPIRPSTPPNQTTSFHASPSPAPTVTPRLLSWSMRYHTPSHPTSPVPTGPFTNRHARYSVAHIAPSPSLVPMHRVLG